MGILIGRSSTLMKVLKLLDIGLQPLSAVTETPALKGKQPANTQVKKL